MSGKTTVMKPGAAIAACFGKFARCYGRSCRAEFIWFLLFFLVLDEHPVGSPLVNTPRSIIVLNEPSLAKFQPRLHADGVQIVNASLISEGLLDGKHRTVYIPVNDIAHELGNVKLANMVALGAWIKATGALPLEAVQEALNRVVSAHYAKLIPVNAKALQAGYDFA